MRVASIDADTAEIAKAKPNSAMRKVSSGAMMMPPALAPFSAQLTANPRRLSNHGATMMLIAAQLIVAHPTDITANAAIHARAGQQARAAPLHTPSRRSRARQLFVPRDDRKGDRPRRTVGWPRE